MFEPHSAMIGRWVRAVEKNGLQRLAELQKPSSAKGRYPFACASDVCAARSRTVI